MIETRSPESTGRRPGTAPARGTARIRGAMESITDSSVGSRILFFAGVVAVSFLLELVVTLFGVPRGAYPSAGFVDVERAGEPYTSSAIPFLVSSASDPGFQPATYRFRFDLDVADGAAIHSPVLVFPQIGGNSLSVEFNGVSLGSVGDPVDGRASIWNTVHIFQVPHNLIKSHNVVYAEILGTYEAGITRNPYLTDRSVKSLRLFALLFVSDYAVRMSMGGLLLVSLIVFGMGFFGGRDRGAKVYLGIAIASTALLLADFVCIQSLPVSIVDFKRIVVAARHAAAALFILAYFRLLEREPGAIALLFTGVQFVCAALVAAYPGDVAEIKKLYTYTYLTVYPLQAYLFIVVFRSLKKTPALRVIVFGFLVSLVTIARDVVYLVVLARPGAIMISHYGFIVLAFTSSLFIINDSLAHYRALAAERQRAALFREESIRDALTGSYNRKLLPVLVENLQTPYSLLAFDLDDFKTLNDTYGHGAGDAVLVDFATVAKRNTRADDWLLRTGGDEFLLALGGCSLQRANVIAEQVLWECRNSELKAPPGSEHRGQTLRYTVSIGISGVGSEGSGQETFDAALARADAELYKAKAGGKNRCCTGEACFEGSGTDLAPPGQAR